MSSRCAFARPAAVLAAALVPSLLPGAPLGAQSDDRPVAPPSVVMTGLDLAVNVDYDEGTLDGTARYTLRNVTEGPVERVPMQVHRLMEITAARSDAGAPLPVEQDIVAYESNARRQVTQAWIELAGPVDPGGSVELEVKWEGTLWGYVEAGNLYVRDRVDEAFTIIREDALAFPTPRVPSGRANRLVPREDFTFRARVGVPDTLVVAAGGRFIGREAAQGRATYTFETTEPAPFLNITIAPYQVLRRGDVRVYHFPDDSVGGRMVLDAIIAAADTLTRWFGPLGEELSLSVMEIPEGYGSQASLQAGIIMDARAFRDRDQLRQLYHEVTHLWNAPEADRPAIRWNEGLATFLEFRLAEAIDGWTGFDAYMPRFVDWFLPRYASDPGNAGVAFADFGNTGKTDLSYSVGFLMFAALEEIVGPATFNDVVGGWYQDRRLEGGTMDEFVTWVDERTPHDLGRFFQDWVYTTRWHDHFAAGESFQEVVAGYSVASR